MNIIFSTIIILFSLFSYFYAPKPKIKIFLSDKANADYIKKRNVKTNNLNNLLRRRIIVGNTYLMNIKEINFLTLTPVAVWTKDELNLSEYEKYFPNNLIQKTKIYELGDNNYASGKINSKEYFQTCLVFKEPIQFKFEFSKGNVRRYNNFKYWRKTFSKNISNNLFVNQSNSFNCLLITTDNPVIFNENNNIINQLVIENFIYR